MYCCSFLIIVSNNFCYFVSNSENNELWVLNLCYEITEFTTVIKQQDFKISLNLTYNLNIYLHYYNYLPIIISKISNAFFILTTKIKNIPCYTYLFFGSLQIQSDLVALMPGLSEFPPEFVVPTLEVVHLSLEVHGGVIVSNQVLCFYGLQISIQFFFFIRIISLCNILLNIHYLPNFAVSMWTCTLSMNALFHKYKYTVFHFCPTFVMLWYTSTLMY